VRQLVYVRRRAVTADLPINGETDYWVFDRNLRCDQITTRDGVFGTIATFSFVPADASEMRIEHALKLYSTDDQVKVVAFPVTDELVDPVVEPEKAPVLFEGILGRMQAEIVTSDQGASEQVSFGAQPMCLLDDRLTEHMITGRWMFDRKTSTEAKQNKPMIAHSPDLPVVFNFNGRPNRSRQLVGTNIITSAVTTASVFTHDDDPDGKPWTVRTALASLIVMRLYGASKRLKPDKSDPQSIGDAPALNRSTCIEPLLRVELDRDATANGLNPQHRNLGMVLPECNVHGLNVLSAIEKVCDAAGLKMAIDCVSAAELTDAVDRRYQLRIWQPGYGPKKEFRLAKPKTAFTRAEDLFKANNIHAFSMMIDGDNVINEVVAAGTASFEGAIILKPAWRLEDVDDAEVDRQLTATSDLKLNGAGYHAKHVVGGVLFPENGHVGRIWIADCVGDPFLAAGTNFAGYASGVYKHATEGFDFVGAFGLGVIGNPVEQERATLGLYDPTIRWSNRVRRAMPLRNAESQDKGVNYIVEVSEDAGVTWKRMPVNVEILREQFGIRLKIPNLATVNYAALKNKTFCQAKDSWWKLIKSELLSFRLTCAIKSDSGAVAFAPRSSTSGSVYRRGRYIAPRGIDEVWQAPGSPVNPTSGVFRRVVGWGGYGATTPTAGFDILQYSTALREAATLQQAATANVRRSMKASLYLFAFGEYQLGDVITKITGRDIPLGTNQGAAEAFPDIVGITYILAPAQQQGITISLADHALDGRVQKKGGR